MTDTIKGPVVNIVDGDTFEMNVTHIGKDNKNKYRDKERIRIAEIDAPEIGRPGSKRSTDLLKRKLKGKVVRCYVQARDTYGRVVAKVKVL